MNEFKTWNEVRAKLNIEKEQELEIELEKELILATIKAREKAGLTQRELSEKTGIVQSSIAKIETFKITPTATTLIKLLAPLGYTLKVVPINENEIN